MSSHDVSLHLYAVVSECGDSVAGDVRWNGLDPTVPLTVELGFRTEGSGVPDSLVVDTTVLGGSTTGSESFELGVPTTGPMSFTGTSIQVVWEVEVHAELRGTPETVATAAVTVLPAGGLAVWARGVADPPAV